MKKNEIYFYGANNYETREIFELIKEKKFHSKERLLESIMKISILKKDYKINNTVIYKNTELIVFTGSMDTFLFDFVFSSSNYSLELMELVEGVKFFTIKGLYSPEEYKEIFIDISVQDGRVIALPHRIDVEHTVKYNTVCSIYNKTLEIEQFKFPLLEELRESFAKHKKRRFKII